VPESAPSGQASLTARTESRKFVVIGGGAAGLTAALELVRQGLIPLVLEQAERVGGLARTEELPGVPVRHGRASLLHPDPRDRATVA